MALTASASPGRTFSRNDNARTVMHHSSIFKQAIYFAAQAIVDDPFHHVGERQVPARRPPHENRRRGRDRDWR